MCGNVAEKHWQSARNATVRYMRTTNRKMMTNREPYVSRGASKVREKVGSASLISYHDEVSPRCGKSEHAHDVLKNNFGGSHIPSHLFGVNAAWWNIAVLAMNVCNVMKRFFLPRGYELHRMKTLRYKFFTLVGKVVTHARLKILKIYSGDAGVNLLTYALNELEGAVPCLT